MQHVAALTKKDAIFDLHVAPNAAFAHPGWQQARAAMLAAVERGGAAVLVGPPGCGKTLLLDDLARTLRQAGRQVRFVARGDAASLASEPGAILLADEAGRIGMDELSALCAGPSPFVLAALPGFKDKLAGLPRSVTPIMLAPLSPEGVARFVAARLAAAGEPRDLIEPAGVLALARHSGGLLRLVNVIGGAAVFLARLEGASHVGASHVAEAASMRDGMGEGEESPDLERPDAVAAPLAPAAAKSAVSATSLRRRAVLGAGAGGLGLAAACAWALRSRTGVQAEAPPPVAAGLQPERVEALVAAPRTVEQAAAQPASPVARQAPAISATPAVFRGPIYNETMGQGGQVRIVLRRQAQPGAVTARFDASAGLLGSGELTGTLSDTGRLSVSGQLMVGRNAFSCDLRGVVSGGTLTGAAGFVRVGGSSVSHSSFRLTQA